METGLHPRLARDAYEAIDALNQSTIKVAYDQSLHHAHWQHTHPSPSTDAQLEGNALHTLILEPEFFDARFAAMPVNPKGDRLSRRTGEGEKAWSAFDSEHPGKHPIKPGRIEELRRIAESVRNHRGARELIERAAYREVTAVWEHPMYGFPCKGQIDLLTVWNGWSVIADLKSCLDASPRGFARAVSNYSYMIQAHWYTEGLAEIARADRRFMFIAFEKDPPHAVCIHELSAELMVEARFRCNRISSLWDQCRRSNSWPGYPTEPQIVAGAPWDMTYRREESIDDGRE